MSGSIRLHPKHGLNPTIPTCFVCGEDKNEVVLLGNAYKGEAPMNMLFDKVPCDKCKAIIASGGVFLIEVRDGESGENPFRTGNLLALKEEAFVRIFDAVRSPINFIEQSAMKKILGNKYDETFKK